MKLQNFRDMVEQTTDWVWEVNLEGILTYTNPRVTELTGYDVHEVVGKIPFDFMDPDGENTDKHYFYEAVANRKPFYQLENTMLHKHGYPIVFETSGAPIINEVGELTGYRGIGRDITVRKDAEKALKQSQDEAHFVIEQANRAKSVFLANMSHEIRTPMNVIIGMANILYDSELDPKQKDCAGMLRESATSLLTIINDILDLSKIEAGMLELAQVNFHLSQEVERTVSSLALQAQKKGLELSCSIHDSVPEIVTGDPTRLQQVLVNLIGNAIKFTESGAVAISLLNNETGVLFSIRDTGIGFSPNKVDWLFQSFTQADTSGTRKYEGTGLGLAISKNLVELMGGFISVKSEENQGSTFYFTIPFALPAGVGEITEECIPIKSGMSLAEQPLWYESLALDILLVEDKPMNQKLATILLEKKGHKVTTAINGREALATLTSQLFDVILMDIHMPEMDGLEATACIRACEDEAVRNIPIIAMTAYAMKEDRDRCLQAGMDYYIPKPINSGELYYALGKVMEGRVCKLNQDIFPLTEVHGMLNRVDGNRDLLKELAEMFFQDYYEDMLKLKAAMDKKDTQAAAVVVHGIKGELGNLGVKTAYKLTCNLEKMIKANALEVASVTLRQLEKELVGLERFFSRPEWQKANLFPGRTF